MRRAVPLAVGLALLVLVLVAGCGGTQAASGDGALPPIADDSRSEAAGFSGAKLDGEQVSLESFRGEPLALIFWASW